MQDDTKCYNAWRRREAHCAPVTQDGTRLALERYEEFKKGYYAGLNAAAFELEQLHRKEKYLHKFYLLASNAIRRMIK